MILNIHVVKMTLRKYKPCAEITLLAVASIVEGLVLLITDVLTLSVFFFCGHYTSLHSRQNGNKDST